MLKTGIDVNRNESILEISINRPKANAIDTNCSRELADVFLMFQEDSDLRAAIITATGEQFFSAGWDLKAGEATDADHGSGGFAGLTEMFHMSKPVIAAVNGMAVGGGFELALACDVIIAADHVAFFLPEVKVGIIPDAGGVLRLPKRIPRAIAMEMMLTGKRLSAQKANDFGLVNKVVPRSMLMSEARAMADEIMSNAPLAIEALKEVIQSTEHLSIEEGLKVLQSDALPIYKQMLHSEDAKEGQQAFIEKRQPVWNRK